MGQFNYTMSVCPLSFAIPLYPDLFSDDEDGNKESLQPMTQKQQKKTSQKQSLNSK